MPLSSVRDPPVRVMAKTFLNWSRTAAFLGASRPVLDHLLMREALEGGGLPWSPTTAPCTLRNIPFAYVVGQVARPADTAPPAPVA